jgi:hypothetical protein
MALAYRNVGVAFLQLAEVLEGATIEEPPADLSPDQRRMTHEQLAPLAPLAAPPRGVAYDEMQSTGVSVVIGVCPIHNEPLRDSKYAGKPAYCSKPGANPAWSNARGYCTINADNVGQYLAIQQRASATR